MGARAQAVEQTGERIKEAALALFRSRPFAEVTLQAIADAAGVTLQTVLRRFGSKENLFRSVADTQSDAIRKAREITHPRNVPEIVRTLVASYEQMGDLNWRGVSQEDQFPLIKQVVDMGREGHRRWVEASFADILAPARGAERQRRTLLLFAATDFYIWKLYRWDLGRSREWTTARMSDLVTALIGDFRRQR